MGGAVMDPILLSKSNKIIRRLYKDSIWKESLRRLNNDENIIVDIACIGDSITQGAGSDADQSKWHDTGFVGRIRTHFKNKYEDVGRGIIPPYTVASSGAQYCAYTYTGNWTDTAGSFGLMQTAKKSNLTNDTATIAFNGTGLAIVMSLNTNTSTFTVAIDGGAPVNLDATSAVILNVKKYEITGLTAGNHTAVITNTGGASKVLYLVGTYEIKGSRGVRVNMMGRSGKLIVDAVHNDAVLQASHDFLAPKLTIISMIANDYSGNTSILDFATRTETLIKRAKRTGDVLLVTTGLRSDGGSFNIDSYVNTYKDLAFEYKCDLVDVCGAWGSYANANSVLQYMSDIVHPNLAGHTDIANRILAVIDP